MAPGQGMRFQVVLSAPRVMQVGSAVNASIMQGTLSPTMCAQKARCPSLVKSLSPEKGSRRGITQEPW